MPFFAQLQISFIDSVQQEWKSIEWRHSASRL